MNLTKSMRWIPEKRQRCLMDNEFRYLLVWDSEPFWSFFCRKPLGPPKIKNVQGMDPIFVRLRFLWCCSILGYHFSFRFLATLLPTTTFPSIFSIFNMLLKFSFWIKWCVTLFTFIRGSSSWHHLVFHHTILFMPCFSKLLCLYSKYQCSLLYICRRRL